MGEVSPPEIKPLGLLNFPFPVSYKILPAFILFNSIGNIFLRHKLWEGKLDGSPLSRLSRFQGFYFVNHSFLLWAVGNHPLQPKPRKIQLLALFLNTTMCIKGGQGVKEALCNPVVVRGLHRPFLRRRSDLLSVPPMCQVLSKSFWHLHMPFIPYAPSSCSWHSSASQLNCPYFTEAFPGLPIVPAPGILS